VGLALAGPVVFGTQVVQRPVAAGTPTTVHGVAAVTASDQPREVISVFGLGWTRVLSVLLEPPLTLLPELAVNQQLEFVRDDEAILFRVVFHRITVLPDGGRVARAILTPARARRGLPIPKDELKCVAISPSRPTYIGDWSLRHRQDVTFTSVSVVSTSTNASSSLKR